MGYYEVQNLCWVLGMLLYLLRHLSHHPSRLWFRYVTVCHLIIDCIWIVFVDCSINQMCRLIQIGKHIIWWVKMTLDKWHMHYKIETQKYSRSVNTKSHMLLAKTWLMQDRASPRINLVLNLNCCVQCRLLSAIFLILTLGTINTWICRICMSQLSTM